MTGERENEIGKCGTDILYRREKRERVRERRKRRERKGNSKVRNTLREEKEQFERKGLREGERD